MKLFNKDSLGYNLFLKKWLIRIVGLISYKRFRNNLEIEGSEIIYNLPNKNVLFVSNHQTYFADVAAMTHVFNSSLNGSENSLSIISYLWNPKLNIYYIAAKETMTQGLLPKILAYTGSISVSRTWRENGKDIERSVDTDDLSRIKTALREGWLITFPQGTTTPWMPIRKGTAHIIKESKPLVVPITIDGFSESFDKKGLKRKEKIKLNIKIKNPLEIDYKNETIDKIVEKISIAIEQHQSFREDN
tara:strand:- start:1112 stop:1849 length:738 start_codon:yes stop_codon:yes gene_type:complete